MTTPKSDAIDGPLYRLLAERLPLCCNESGVLQVATLADKLKMSVEGVYRWLRADEISKRGRKRVVALAESEENESLLESDLDTLTEDDLRPFS